MAPEAKLPPNGVPKPIGNSVRKLEFVVETKSISQILRRDAPGGVLEKTGYLALNTEGSLAWDRCVRARNMDPETTGAFFGVDLENKVVGAVPLEPGEAGATRVVRAERPAYAMHLANVFEKHEVLRPVERQEVFVDIEYDAQEKPYLAIFLQTGKGKATTTREGSVEHQRRAETKRRRAERKKA